MHLSGHTRPLIFLLATSLWLGATQLATADAGWLTRILREAGEAGGSTARRGLGELDDAAARLRKLPAGISAGAVAGTGRSEGHWTFVNRAGQRFTAANSDEMRRLGGALFPEGPGPAGLTIYLTEPTVFRQRNALQDLPARARLRLVVDRDSYPLEFRVAADNKQVLLAAVRSNVLVPVTRRAAFHEALWQLNRPLKRAGIRVLALAEDGPAALSPVARIEPTTKRPAVDRIQPDKLAAALPSLKGQTAILTGRIDDQRRLTFRRAGGFEASLDLEAVYRQATAYDVNLVVLNSRAPRQPGARNWFWQTVDVDGLGDALTRERMADFLSVVAGTGGKVEVRVADPVGNRVSISIVAAEGGITVPGSGTIGDVIAELASEVVGTVAATAVEMDVVSAGRRKELDSRIIPGIPSALQFGYLLALFAGVMGLPVARRWWRWLWPLEARGEYAGWFGYQAARVVRLAIFVLLFLPLAGVPAAVWHLLATLWRWLTLPWRLLRWVFGPKSAENST